MSQYKESEIINAIHKAMQAAFEESALQAITDDEAREIAQARCDQIGATLDPESAKYVDEGRTIQYSATLPGKIQRIEGLDFKWETQPDDRIRSHHDLNEYGEPVKRYSGVQWPINLKSGNATGSTSRIPCPDCAHTETPGQYVGLTERGPCVTCGGTCEVVR